MDTTTRVSHIRPPQQHAPKFTVEELFNIEQAEAYGYDPAYYGEENSWNYYTPGNHQYAREEHQYIHYDDEANLPRTPKRPKKRSRVSQLRR